MKKLILSAFFLLTLAGVISAQCTPNPIYVATGIPGVYPIPQQQGIPDGTLNQAYNQTLTVIVPQDTTVDLSVITGTPGLPTVTADVNYEQLNGITGFPTGMSYVCDTAACTWLAADNGCIKLTGTPTQAGTFQLDLDLVLNIAVPPTVPIIGGTNIDIPLPVSYEWRVIDPLGVEELQDDRFTVAQNGPNPFSGETTILFNAPKGGDVHFTLRDLSGRILRDLDIQATPGRNSYRLDANGLSAGAYFYILELEGERITHVMNVMN